MIRDKLLEEKPDIEHELRDMPWNEIVRVIYSRAAYSGKVKFRSGQMLTKELHDSIVTGNNLVDVKMLAKAFKEMAERGAAKRLLRTGIPTRTLTKINVPGAWLLDTLYTMMMILVKKIKQNPSIHRGVERLSR